jgi:hypothetical protein
VRSATEPASRPTENPGVNFQPWRAQISKTIPAVAQPSSPQSVSHNSIGAPPAAASRDLSIPELLQQILLDPGIIELSKSRTAGSNLGKVYDIVVGKLPGPTIHWSGDTEGRINNDVRTLMAEGKIIRTPDGEWTLADPNARFAHTGDAVGDRGPNGLLDCYVQTRLKANIPDRVTGVWGNRENKILMHQDLRRMEKGEGEIGRAYWQHLANTGLEDTLSRRVDYRVNVWQENVGGAPNALKFHREGLREIIQMYKDGKLNDVDLKRLHVTPSMDLRDEAVAEHYVACFKPGGTYFEYMRNLNFVGDPAVLGENRILTHGGLTELSITRAPGSTLPPKDLQEWAQRWNTFGREGFAAAEDAINKGIDIPSNFADALNSHYQVTTGENLSRPFSTIYLDPAKDGANYRGAGEGVVAFARGSSVTDVHQGHKPMNESSRTMEAPRPDGKASFQYHYHDTSYGDSVNLTSSVGQAMVRVVKVNAKEVMVAINMHGADSPFGKVTKDGFTIDGLVLSGPNRGKFRLSQYATDGRHTNVKYITGTQLEKQDAQTGYGKTSASSGLSAALLEKIESDPSTRERFGEMKVVNEEQFAAEVPRGSINVLGAAKLGLLDPNVSESRVAESISVGMDNLVEVMSAKRERNREQFVALHGGTATKRTVNENDVSKIVDAPETALMTSMVRLGRGKGMGAVPPQCDPDYIAKDGPGKNSMEYVTAVGKNSEDWAAPGIFEGKLVHEKGGARIFLGGSTGLIPTLEADAALSRSMLAQGKKPALVFLLDHKPKEGTDSTASALFAAKADKPVNHIPISLEQFERIGNHLATIEDQYARWDMRTPFVPVFAT